LKWWRAAEILRGCAAFGLSLRLAHTPSTPSKKGVRSQECRNVGHVRFG
jgi:hypothetical protein